MKRLVRISSAWLLGSCSSGPGAPLAPPPPPVDQVASVEVAPPTLTLKTGEVRSATCTPKDSTGAGLANECHRTSGDVSVVAPTSNTQTTRLTGGKEGTTWIIAAVAELKDSLRVMVVDTSAPPLPPPWSCPASGYDRLVNVSTATELRSALAGARPGDQIRLAPAAYAGFFIASAVGTEARPITLCGPETAILLNDGGDNGLYMNGAEWWLLRGFTVASSSKGIMIDRSHHNVFDSLTIAQIDGECVHFRRHSSHNTISRSWIHHCGRVNYTGEGIYVGSARSNWDIYTGGEPDTANDNRIERNLVEDVVAEGIEMKEGTRRTLVRGNTVRRTGGQVSPSGQVGATAAIAMRGSGAVFDSNNVEAGGAPQVLHGFQVYGGRDGDDNTFQANEVTNVTGFGGFGFFIDPGQSGNVVMCDNRVNGSDSASPEFANVPCQP